MAFEVSLNAATATGAGSSIDLKREAYRHTFFVETTGNPSSYTVVVEVSPDDSTWAQANGGTVFRSGTGTETHSKTGEFVARYVRANLTSLSGGSSPTVTVKIASQQ